MYFFPLSVTPQSVQPLLSGGRPWLQPRSPASGLTSFLRDPRPATGSEPLSPGPGPARGIVRISTPGSVPGVFVRDTRATRDPRPPRPVTRDPGRPGPLPDVNPPPLSTSSIPRPLQAPPGPGLAVVRSRKHIAVTLIWQGGSQAAGLRPWPVTTGLACPAEVPQR